MNPGGNVGPGGQDSSVKISVHFINVYPLKKPKFSSVWPGPSFRWLPFEHSSIKTGSLDIQPLYSTLCPSITSTRSTSSCHSNTFQYSVSGLVMLDAFTYGKDCRKHSNQCIRHQSRIFTIWTVLLDKGWTRPSSTQIRTCTTSPLRAIRTSTLTRT